MRCSVAKVRVIPWVPAEHCAHMQTQTQMQSAFAFVFAHEHEHEGDGASKGTGCGALCEGEARVVRKGRVRVEVGETALCARVQHRTR